MRLSHAEVEHRGRAFNQERDTLASRLVARMTAIQGAEILEPLSSALVELDGKLSRSTAEELAARLVIALVGNRDARSKYARTVGAGSFERDLGEQKAAETPHWPPSSGSGSAQ